MKLILSLIAVMVGFEVGAAPNLYTGNFSATNFFKLIGAGGNPTANYGWVSISNGLVAIPAFNNNFSGPISPGIIFVNTNGVIVGQLGVWADHGGAVNTPEFLIDSDRNIAIRPGNDGSKNAACQLGLSGDDHAQFYIQYDDDPGNMAFNDGLTVWPFGHSKRLGFQARVPAGYAEPGIIGFANQNVADAALSPDITALGELHFYSSIPQWDNGNSTFATYPGVKSGRMLTNGWDLRGKLIQQRTTDTISGSTYSLDFNKSYCMDVSVATASTITFSTANATASSSDYEKRVFLIRSLGYTPTFVWPAGFCVLGASAGGTLPTTMSPIQLLKIEIESVGIGESNKLATATLSVDNNFSWDPDATKFFRAVIGGGDTLTLTMSNAVNNLVLAAKAHSWWTLPDAAYPMVGGTATAHAWNLINTNLYKITWSGGLTHDANGVTGNGTSGFGDTGFNPFSVKTTSRFQTNSAHVFFYCGTASPNDSRLISVSHGGANIAQLQKSSGNLLGGLNNGNPSAFTLVAPSGNFQGTMLATRSTSTAMIGYFNAASSGTDTTATTGVGDQNIYLLARDDDGADNWSTANCRGVSIGANITSSVWADMRADWDAYQTALSRKVP